LLQYKEGREKILRLLLSTIQRIEIVGGGHIPVDKPGLGKRKGKKGGTACGGRFVLGCGCE